MNKTHTTTYRGGWSTSICDLFTYPLRRDNCCAITCCGLLLSDRNAHLMLEETRPSWIKRFGLNIGFPVAVFLILNVCYNFFAETTEQDEYWEIGIFWTTIFMISFLLWRAKSERIKVRQAVMRRMYDKQFHGNQAAFAAVTIASSAGGGGETNVETYIQTNSPDIHAAHSTICCFQKDTIDIPLTDHSLRMTQPTAITLRTDGDGPLGMMEQPPKADCCTCIFQWLANCFFGLCCGCWLQCCGMCAIGQEAREIEMLLDKKALQMDYITFQPYSDYYPRILELREQNVTNFISHWKVISKLSFNLVKILLVTSFVLTIIALLELNPVFRIENLLMVVATFFQAFLVLFVVHWYYHRFDISIDAVIKYFASGFCLCTFLSLMYEIIISMIIGFVSQIIVALEIGGQLDPDATDEEIDYYFEQWSGNHMWTILFFHFLDAFIVAGLVEELSKYFAFYMVETPDLMDAKDLILERRRTNASSSGAVVTKYQINEDSQSSITEDNFQTKNNTFNIVDDLGKNTLTSRGVGITVAMVAVAAGFACSENLLYVFVYTEPGLENELSTLLTRSLFPVHPLCAAIQSIGVVNRDLLNDDNYQLGRIIFPALLLHGLFDFALMVIGYLDDLENPPQEGIPYPDDVYTEVEELYEDYNKYDTIALNICLGLVIVGLFYYTCLADRQRTRLEDLDAAEMNNDHHHDNDNDNALDDNHGATTTTSSAFT